MTVSSLENSMKKCCIDDKWSGTLRLPESKERKTRRIAISSPRRTGEKSDQDLDAADQSRPSNSDGAQEASSTLASCHLSCGALQEPPSLLFHGNELAPLVAACRLAISRGRMFMSTAYDAWECIFWGIEIKIHTRGDEE